MITTQNFTEAKLEEAIIELLADQGYPYTRGTDIQRSPSDVLIRSDLRDFLTKRYATYNITDNEIDSIIRQLDALNAADLYDSNKTICKWVSDGFLLKREDRNQKDLYIQLIDYAGLPLGRGGHADHSEELAGYQAGDKSSDDNIYKVVNQLEIEGREKRIPDAILYINGLPLVVFEFKSAIRENATLHDAYKQLTIRYARDMLVSSHPSAAMLGAGERARSRRTTVEPFGRSSTIRSRWDCTHAISAARLALSGKSGHESGISPSPCTRTLTAAASATGSGGYASAIFEGHTISTLPHSQQLTPVLRASNQRVLAAVSNNQLRVVVDGGFTRYASEYNVRGTKKGAGTLIWATNIAAYLERVERTEPGN